MSPKFIKISSCACFIILTGVLFALWIYFPGLGNIRDSGNQGFKDIAIFFPKPEVQCHFDDLSDYPLKLKAPSLESFIRASTTMKDQELRLSGLVVFSNLTSACQPLADVSKAKIQVNKIALIRLANETACPLQGLVEHAQNAGYSLVIFLGDLYSYRFDKETQLQDNLLIPVLAIDPFYYCYFTTNNSHGVTNFDDLAVDRTSIEITVLIVETADDLTKMQEYLRRLYYWFLLGPVITLEWLRRRKKQAQAGRIPEEITVQSGLNSAADYEETQRNYNQESEHEQTRGETQPLLPVTNGHRRPRAVRRVLTYLSKLLGKLAVNSVYVILIVVALPVGISSGGWSFFRFDQNEIQQMTFWDDLIVSDHYWLPQLYIFYSFLPLLWSPLQIFCFFLYSTFSCRTTWTVPANFSKLIRSDWFASNVYLLILGVVVPYCSFTMATFKFPYFAAYNMVCTICNLLFIIILNKHKFVTRYVFYISVCMICAYIESDIVAVFYFMLNSEGSLANLKLTALRTVAIGLTLTLSFNTSMHIIRKLAKPRESLFEGLAEK